MPKIYDLAHSCTSCPYGRFDQAQLVGQCVRHPPRVILVPVQGVDIASGQRGVNAVPAGVWPSVPAGGVCGEHPELAWLAQHDNRGH
jgi:hypothetical protein